MKLFVTLGKVTPGQVQHVCGGATYKRIAILQSFKRKPVTITARLRVVERAQPLRHTLHFIELYLIILVCSVIHQAVAFAVEAGGCNLRLRSLRGKHQNQRTDYHPDPHVGHPFGVTSLSGG